VPCKRLNDLEYYLSGDDTGDDCKYYDDNEVCTENNIFGELRAWPRSGKSICDLTGTGYKVLFSLLNVYPA